MFDFLTRKNKKNVKRDGLDSTIHSSEMVETEENVQEEKNEVHTKLYYHPHWNIKNEQKYVFSFLNNELPPLKPNQLSLSGIEIIKTQRGLLVSTFIRNSLAKPIKLGELPLLLLDENKQVIASHEFDGSIIGEIPAESSLPWQFVFPKDTIKMQEFNNKNWTLAFNLSKSSVHRLDLAESWEKSLNDETKKQLEDIVSKLPKLQENELNLTGIQAKLNDDGDFQATIFIRNGAEKNVNIEKIPLKVIDADGDVVAEGGFTLEDFTVKANTSKPWTFIFPQSMVKKQEMNLSTWRVETIQDQNK